MNRLVIFGAGGFGREIAAAIKTHTKYVFCTDDGQWGITPDMITDSDEVVVAIGCPKARRKVVESLSTDNYRLMRSNHSIIAGRVTIGEGSCVMAGTVMTDNITIGKHVIVNLNATIGHDCTIGDFVTISPAANISGKVTIGNGCYIGTNASIKEGVTICDNVTIGMGSVVLNDITESGTYVGVPVKKVK